MKAETRFIGKGDVLVYAVLLLLLVGLFAVPALQNAKSDGCVAEISVDGAVVETVELSALLAPQTRHYNGCTLELSADGVRFTAATCPDRLCVRFGNIHTPGTSNACVPNRVVVTLRRPARGEDFDVVAY